VKNKLLKNAVIIIETSCQLKPKESILILTDRDKFRMTCAYALEQAALELGALPVIMDISTFRRATEGKPKKDFSVLAIEPIKKAVESADVTLLIWSSWSTCGFGRLVGDPAANDLALSGQWRWFELMTKDMDKWDITKEDVIAVQKRTKWITRKFATATEIYITTPAGTDFKCTLGPKATCIALLYYVPLYAEATIVPAAGSGEGVYVIDGGGIEKPIHVTVKAGRMIGIGGENAEKVAWIKDLIAKSMPSEANIDEVAIITTHIPENDISWGDRKYGTAHIALGNSRKDKNQIHGSLHIDGHMKSPSVSIDGIQVMKDGVFIDPAIN